MLGLLGTCVLEERAEPPHVHLLQSRAGICHPCRRHPCQACPAKSVQLMQVVRTRTVAIMQASLPDTGSVHCGTTLSLPHVAAGPRRRLTQPTCPSVCCTPGKPPCLFKCTCPQQGVLRCMEPGSRSQCQNQWPMQLLWMNGRTGVTPVVYVVGMPLQALDGKCSTVCGLM
jgi:hypothetical protein